MGYDTLDVRFKDGLCRVRLDRADAGNALNARMVEELSSVLALCATEDRDQPVTILVLEGAASVFCSGGDFEATAGGAALDPAPLYDLWTHLATGPFISIALVRGRANAGGVGLACSCDLVLCDRSATFSLSELLFGLFPACVMPFLVRRTGLQKAHHMALMTRPIPAAEALASGLADAVGDDAEALLASHLPRLTRLTRPAIARYKSFMGDLTEIIDRAKPMALAANREMFEDATVRRNISRYVTEMKLPWED
ncbi:enoyl-CoA hydratase/isomerase [Hyphomicrobium sp.]|uniref:enoyl-CoA hydratase/isomerase n=1 Tax=Hyphomicrobium sp. TaxID=82 RepID=UPI003F70E7C5